MNNSLNIIALLLITGVTPIFAQNDPSQQLVVPLTDPGKSGSLEVGIISGSIHVVGYNGKDVVIDAMIPKVKKKMAGVLTGTPSQV